MDKKDWYLKYKELPFEQRKNLVNPIDLRKNARLKKMFTKKSWNKIENLVYKKKLCSKRHYEKYKKEFDGEMPSVEDIKRTYGSWKKFRDKIFTPEEVSEFRSSTYTITKGVGKPPIDDDKIFNLAKFLDLKTIKDFEAAKKAYPDLVPCFQTIRKHFGGIKNFRKILQMRNLKSIIERYITLCWNFKTSRLTPYHCRRNGVDIDWAIESLGTKKKFYEMVEFYKSIVERFRSKESKKSGENNENRTTNKRES